MFVTPSKMKIDRILIGRTINFETERKMYGNLVVIATDSYDDIGEVMTHALFRPQQMYCAYTPRIVKPLNRKIVRIDQASVYADLRSRSEGRLKMGKPFITSYAGRNIMYDMIPEYRETLALCETKHGFARFIAMKGFMEQMLPQAVGSAGYGMNYLVFPICQYSDKLSSVAKMGSFDDSDGVTPLSVFLLTVRKGLADMSAYSKFDRIIFYNPAMEAVVVLDPKDPDFFKTADSALLKVVRLNSACKGESLIGDDVDTEGIGESDESDQEDERSDEVKDGIVAATAKDLKVRGLGGFSAGSKEEEDAEAELDNKIKAVASKKENAAKDPEALKAQLASDPEIKAAAAKYIETKRVDIKKLDALSKGLDKEASVIGQFDKATSGDSEEGPKAKAPEADAAAKNPSPEGDKAIEAKPIDIGVKGFDDRVKHSALRDMDKAYNEKQAKKDMLAVLTSFSNSEYLPMTLDRLDVTDTSDDFNRRMTVKAHYRTNDGSSVGFTLDVPTVIDGRFILVNGNKMFIEKQLLRLPVVKTKPDVVEISTSYSKITVERTSEKVSRRNIRLLKILKAAEPSARGWKIAWGDNTVHNDAFVSDFEYEEIAGSVSSIDASRYSIDFDRQRLTEEIGTLDFPDGFFAKDSDDTPLAIEKSTSDVVHIKGGKVYLAVPSKDGKKIISDDLIAGSMHEFILSAIGLSDAKMPTIGKSFVYSRAKMIETFYPVFSLCGFMEGMTNVLKRYGVRYYFKDKRDASLVSKWVEIRFADGYLYYEDTMRNTMLLDILYMMDTADYNFREFDTERPYTDFFVNRLGQVPYARNTIRLHLSAMVDPITYDVQKDLRQPTDIVGMLLFANTLLTTNTCRDLNDARNYRIRGNEEIYAAMYKVIADAYKNFQNARMNGHRGGIDLPRNALIKTLTNQVNINPASVLNPVLELESSAACTAKGFNGVNLDRAYTLKMRSYDDKSMMGFISGNDTQFGGTAGITRSISYDPKITDVRGYITDVDHSKLSATNVLSPAEMLASFVSAQSDAPRSAMQISQTKHTMPVLHAHKQLVGSGINKTMAFMLSDDFCFKAKKDGIIKTIDEKERMAILAYDDGTNDAIDLGDVLVKNSNSGFFIKEHFLIKYKEGERFKAGDVIAYNPSYFSGKGKNVDYLPGTLAKVALAPSDGAFQDSTMLSESLAKDSASYFTMMTSVALGPNAVIYETAKVGDDIKTEDPLLVYSKSYIDPTTAQYMQSLRQKLGSGEVNDLSKDRILSRYSGKVVGVKVYYNMKLSDLNPTLRKMVEDYKGSQITRSEMLTRYKVPHGGSLHLDTTEQMTADGTGKSKVNGTDYSGILIEYYVEMLDPIGPGDKITYTSALKGVVSKIFADDERPVCEYHPEIPVDAICTPTGILGRMTIDFFSYLYSNKVLVEVGRMIKAIKDY
jgi:hypothetical protein